MGWPSGAYLERLKTGAGAGAIGCCGGQIIVGLEGEQIGCEMEVIREYYFTEKYLSCRRRYPR